MFPQQAASSSSSLSAPPPPLPLFTSSPGIQHPLEEDGEAEEVDVAEECSPTRGTHTEPVERGGLDMGELKAAMMKESAAQEPLVEIIGTISQKFCPQKYSICECIR